MKYIDHKPKRHHRVELKIADLRDAIVHHINTTTRGDSVPVTVPSTATLDKCDGDFELAWATEE